MATININGLECKFEAVPLGVLESWRVSMNTHLLAYRLHTNQLHNSTICAMLSSAYEFGAFERPPFWALDEVGKAAVLLENPSATVMDSITNWIRWTSGPGAMLYVHPYRRALLILRKHYEDMGQDIERTADLLRYKRDFQRLRVAGSPLKEPLYGENSDN